MPDNPYRLNSAGTRIAVSGTTCFVCWVTNRTWTCCCPPCSIELGLLKGFTLNREIPSIKFGGFSFALPCMGARAQVCRNNNLSCITLLQLLHDNRQWRWLWGITDTFRSSDKDARWCTFGTTFGRSKRYRAPDTSDSGRKDGSVEREPSRYFKIPSFDSDHKFFTFFFLLELQAEYSRLQAKESELAADLEATTRRCQDASGTQKQTLESSISEEEQSIQSLQEEISRLKQELYKYDDVDDMNAMDPT